MKKNMNVFCPLASGSKGNAIYFATKQTKLLIDIGLRYNELLLRLSEINVDINDIDAILVTHEHIDHVQGLKSLVGKVDIPVFTNSETAKAIYSNLQVLPKFRIFTTDESFQFKDLTIHPFSIQHDTLDPVAFVIKTDFLKVGICTDLGLVTTLVKKNLAECDYLYIEANHDVGMLYSSKRPHYLKKRISGRQGHLSNEECVELLQEVLHPNLKHIYLAHQSADCNNKELSKKIVQDFLTKSKSQATVSVTYQEKISKCIEFNQG